MPSIYILRLENDKYYIGKSNNVNQRIKEHQEGRGADWTKIFKPLETDKIINDCDNFDEDKYVKIYMAKYGIENVRGGSYCKIRLSNEQVMFLEYEICSAEDKCFKCGSLNHFTSECSENRNFLINAFHNASLFAQGLLYKLPFMSSKISIDPKAKVKCYSCHNYGHYASDCTGIKIKSDQCFKCKGIGHFSKNCNK